MDFSTGVKKYRLKKFPRKCKTKVSSFQRYQNEKRLKELERLLAWQKGPKRQSPFAGIAFVFCLWLSVVGVVLALANAST